MASLQPAVRTAYEECRRLARRHYENFPTASRLVPRDKRDALAAIYAFARYADDVADEPGRGAQAVRLQALAEWRQKLDDCYAGRATHPVFIALHDASQRFDLSREHFENLLRAFESDVRVSRHQNFDSLLSYCTCSANPVGRLVLELFGHRDPELFTLSDKICTALQLTNFWQDVRVDFERDRVYLPLDDLDRFHYSLEDLRAQTADGRWRELMQFECGRTRELFEQGRALPERVTPELRRQLRLTWLGGTEILSRIEAAGYDVFHRRPSLRKRDFLRLYLRARSPFNGIETRDVGFESLSSAGAATREKADEAPRRAESGAATSARDQGRSRRDEGKAPGRDVAGQVQEPLGDGQPVHDRAPALQQLRHVAGAGPGRCPGRAALPGHLARLASRRSPGRRRGCHRRGSGIRQGRTCRQPVPAVPGDRPAAGRRGRAGTPLRGSGDLAA